MTAASGVVHEEFHEREFAKKGGTLEMVQLWVNLPKKAKMAKPHYQTLLDKDIPKIDLGGNGYARIIAGEFKGKKGPAGTHTRINVIDVKLSIGQTIEFECPEGFIAGFLLLNGLVQVNNKVNVQEGKFALFKPQGEQVRVQAKEDVSLLLLSGEPIDEPIVNYGPFVMNTQAEIKAAIEDYRNGRMGKLS